MPGTAVARKIATRKRLMKLYSRAIHRGQQRSRKNMKGGAK